MLSVVHVVSHAYDKQAYRRVASSRLTVRSVARIGAFLGPGSMLQRRISFPESLRRVHAKSSDEKRTLSRRAEADSRHALASPSANVLGTVAIKAV